MLFFIILDDCVIISRPLYFGLLLVLGLYREEYLHFLKIKFPFPYIPLAIRGNVGKPKTCLTSPAGLLSLLKLSVSRWFAIVVYSKFFMAFCVVTLLFGVNCWWKGFWNMVLRQIFFSSILKRVVYISIFEKHLKGL